MEWGPPSRMVAGRQHLDPPGPKDKQSQPEEQGPLHPVCPLCSQGGSFQGPRGEPGLFNKAPPFWRVLLPSIGLGGTMGPPQTVLCLCTPFCLLLVVVKVMPSPGLTSVGLAVFLHPGLSHPACILRLRLQLLSPWPRAIARKLCCALCFLERVSVSLPSLLSVQEDSVLSQDFTSHIDLSYLLVYYLSFYLSIYYHLSAIFSIIHHSVFLISFLIYI